MKNTETGNKWFKIENYLIFSESIAWNIQKIWLLYVVNWPWKIVFLGSPLIML